jgi:hypothetical protein
MLTWPPLLCIGFRYNVNKADPITKLHILTLCLDENTKLYREHATSVPCKNQTQKEKVCQKAVDLKQNNSINGKKNPEKINHGLKVKN